MVATTVILAAVIGTFVLGLGEDVDQTATAGVAQTGDTTVTLNSLGPNTDGIRCSDSTKNGKKIDDTNTNYDSGDSSLNGVTTDVGETITCTNSANSVVAFGDGIQDATVYTFDS